MFTTGLETAKIPIISKNAPKKLCRIKFPKKNLVAAYFYLSQE